MRTDIHIECSVSCECCMSLSIATFLYLVNQAVSVQITDRRWHASRILNNCCFSWIVWLDLFIDRLENLRMLGQSAFELLTCDVGSSVWLEKFSSKLPSLRKTGAIIGMWLNVNKRFGSNIDRVSVMARFIYAVFMQQSIPDEVQIPRIVALRITRLCEASYEHARIMHKTQVR